MKADAEWEALTKKVEGEPQPLLLLLLLPGHMAVAIGASPSR
jgi:hypothetical protein